MVDDRFLVCDERDWEGLSPEQRDWMLFKTLRSVDSRLHSLEKWNKAFSFFGGVIGGAMAAFGIKFWG